MDPTTQQWSFRKGDKVYSADDVDLGKVVAVEPETGKPAHLVVEKGLLAKRTLTVPVGAVCNYADGTIYLDLPEAALGGGG